MSETSGWNRPFSSPAEILGAIPPGARIFVGSACATPRRLISILEEAHDPPPGIQLIHFLTDGAVPVYESGPFTSFRHKSFFIGSDMRALMGTGKIDYVPISVSQVHRLIENGRVPVDVAFVQLSPPDSKGQASLGVSVDITLSAVRNAKTVVAEINPNMPRTHGDTTISVDDVDFAVWVDSPIIEYVHRPADEVAERIARYIARIIDDGSTIQIGVGRIPSEMLRYLVNRRDLGVHSDVVTEPLVDLVEKGVVTGERKTLNPGRIVTSYCMGTRRLYDLVDDNPMFSFQPIHYVCEPAVIASNANMVSVTQAFAIDLTGQICADQFEGEFYGGVSSQPEFLRGAAASDGGKAIVCLSSRTDDGRPRIRGMLRDVEGVTIPRSDVHYVVSEYGVAYLFGRSISERATALVEIAHPDDRETLLADAKRLNYLPKAVAFRSRRAYPAEEEREVTLGDGRTVLIRPTRATDVEMIQELFYSLSAEDVFTRFFTNLKSLDVSKAQHLCSVSYEDEMAFIAVVGDREKELVVGSSCYYVNPSTNLADCAYMIRPEWQGLGLATILQDRMAEYAKARGAHGFTADVLCDNARMMKVFEKSGLRLSTKVVSGVFEVTMLFD